MRGLLEYPQYPRHFRQLTALVPILILGEPPQVPRISALVHILGTLRNPAVTPESVYVEWWLLQVLVYQSQALAVIIHGVGTRLLLALIVQLGTFPAKERVPGQIQIPPPLTTGRTEEKGLIAAEPIFFAGYLNDLAPSIFGAP